MSAVVQDSGFARVFAGSAACFLTLLVLLSPRPLGAQEQLDCAGCHDDIKPTSTAHAEVGCQDCHSNITTRRHKKTALAETSSREICAQCHAEAEELVSQSVHKKTWGCLDCHGGQHDIRMTSDLASPMSPFSQIKVCGGCHENDSGLIAGYINSVHGRGLLKSGLIAAPSCSDCHGHHRVVLTDSEESPTSHVHAPEMCGKCHVGILETWSSESAHGLAWQAGDPEAPVCTTCHHSHKIDDPERPGPRLHLPDECGNCHGDLYSTYRLTFHGKATNLGLVASATCSDCHTPHANLAADDPRSSIHPDNLDETCGACHAGVSQAFLEIDPHNDPTDRNDNPYVFYVYTFMMTLLIGVFAFFGIHDILWLQRSFVGTLRGEFHGLAIKREEGPYVRRFPGIYIFMHITIILTFLALAITGLPLKFDNAPWAQTMMNMLGGLDAARIIHRIAAIGTFGYMAFHLIHLAIRIIFKHERGMFWGPDSMVPQWQDVKDMFANVRYFLYLGPHPQGDRWTYWEKFDYLAVFWGVMIIGLSGLMLWFPEFFTLFLPGWTINAAAVIHSDEALLATGFIFVFHFFHTHLRPESFPMDPVVFTGRMPLEKFKEERPREYRRMVEKGTLESALCDPPTREEMAWIIAFGFFALSIGLALAVGIFWALLSH
jgi:thiosulfate reductase cytochrome b subunit